MKRTCLLFLIFFASISGRLLAQGNAYEEERYRILSNKISTIFDTLEVIQKRQSDLQQRCVGLEREIDKLRDEMNRGTLKFATQESVKALAEKLQEVEKKRAEDKKLILDSFKELSKLPVSPGPAETKHSAPPAEASDPYIYEVQSGDSLGAIVTAYNKLFKEKGLGRITTDQVAKLNNLKQPLTVYKGQKLKIPEPVKH